MWTSMLAALLSAAPAGPSIPPSATEAYAQVLERNVEDGLVDYARLARKDLPRLERFLDAVAEADLPASKNARVGILVDAYNALVLRSVIRHDIPSSVLNVDGFFDEETHRVAGRDLTLDALEKRVLGPIAQDARIHFVLVCAAKGCPILERAPYSGSDMDARMEAAARRYVRSPAGARVVGEDLQLSKIFQWYAEDFGGRAGTLRFVRSRLAPERRRKLSSVPEITFFEYDWSVNRI
jgi:hypothetical protein